MTILRTGALPFRFTRNCAETTSQGVRDKVRTVRFQQPSAKLCCRNHASFVIYVLQHDRKATHPNPKHPFLGMSSCIRQHHQSHCTLKASLTAHHQVTSFPHCTFEAFCTGPEANVRRVVWTPCSRLLLFLQGRFTTNSNASTALVYYTEGLWVLRFLAEVCVLLLLVLALVLLILSNF